MIQRQLLAMFNETPHETDCSVSVAVLDSMGCRGREAQATWLRENRGAWEGKDWECHGDRWVYATTAIPAQPQRAESPPTWIRPERAFPQIVVTPATPLSKRSIGKTDFPETFGTTLPT